MYLLFVYSRPNPCTHSPLPPRNYLRYDLRMFFCCHQDESEGSRLGAIGPHQFLNDSPHDRVPATCSSHFTGKNLIYNSNTYVYCISMPSLIKAGTIRFGFSMILFLFCDISCLIMYFLTVFVECGVQELNSYFIFIKAQYYLGV